MRTYAQWLSIDQKSRSEGLSTLPSDLLLKQFNWMVTGEYHSFEKPKREEQESCAPKILGNLMRNFWETVNVVVGETDKKLNEKKQPTILFFSKILLPISIKIILHIAYTRYIFCIYTLYTVCSCPIQSNFLFELMLISYKHFKVSVSREIQLPVRKLGLSCVNMFEKMDSKTFLKLNLSKHRQWDCHSIAD